MFELKKYKGLMFIALNIDSKFDRKLTRTFKNDMENLEILTRALKSLNIGTLM